jgi:hypothetical protein
LGREARLREGLSRKFRIYTTVLSDGRRMLASTELTRTYRIAPMYVSEERLIVARAVFDWMARYPSTRDSSENVISVAEESRKSGLQ